MTTELSAVRGDTGGASAAFEPRPYLNEGTIAHVGSMVLNAMLYLGDASTPLTCAANLPLRIWDSVKAFQREDYTTILVHVLALSILAYDRDGAFVVLILDVILECIHICRGNQGDKPFVSKRKGQEDPKTRDGALKILNLTEPTTAAKIREAADVMRKKLQESLNRIPTGSAIAQELQKLIADVTSAEGTLMGEVLRA